jgi:microcystin-dependent protein
MSDFFIGEIRVFGFNWAPRSWALCDGATLSIQQNTALFSLLGIQFGGDGKTNFKIPDLRGRTPLGFGRSPVSGAVYQMGNSAGVETVTLTQGTMPVHNHALNGRSDTTTPSPGIANNLLASTLDITPPVTDHLSFASATGATLQPLNSATVIPTGGNAAHNNMQPFSVMNFCIATMGIYPPRA